MRGFRVTVPQEATGRCAQGADHQGIAKMKANARS